jgi:hypothetical protein
MKEKSTTYPILLGSLGLAHYKSRPEGRKLEELKRYYNHLYSIHGSSRGIGDDRREVREASPDVQAIAHSVALVCDASKLFPQAGGAWKLDTRTTGLLSPERFAEQEAVPDGFTGFLVGENLLLTTAHGIGNPIGLCVVFDYLLDSQGTVKSTYAADQVFFVTKEENRRYNPLTKEDWLLLRLNANPGRPSRSINKNQAPAGTSLWMLGHPLGLPMKFVDGATITKVGNPCFECDLDASGGNSGSMVLDSTSSSIIGVLQRTAPAFGSTGVWLWCLPGENCPTEVTASSAFESAVASAASP